MALRLVKRISAMHIRKREEDYVRAVLMGPDTSFRSDLIAAIERTNQRG